MPQSSCRVPLPSCTGSHTFGMDPCSVRVGGGGCWKSGVLWAEKRFSSSSRRDSRAHVVCFFFPLESCTCPPPSLAGVVVVPQVQVKCTYGFCMFIGSVCLVEPRPSGVKRCREPNWASGMWGLAEEDGENSFKAWGRGAGEGAEGVAGGEALHRGGLLLGLGDHLGRKVRRSWFGCARRGCRGSFYGWDSWSGQAGSRF